MMEEDKFSFDMRTVRLAIDAACSLATKSMFRYVRLMVSRDGGLTRKSIHISTVQ